MNDQLLNTLDLTAPDSGLLLSQRVAIIGLGLMGGSLALALRGSCGEIIGIDPDLDTVELARKNNVVDRAATDPRELLTQADLIVLAAPIGGILSILKELPDLHPGPAVVLDIGSTKGQILEAMTALPERFDPVGCHPMCGKEKNSLENAAGSLFRGAPFVLSPLPRTSLKALACALEIISLTGGLPLLLEPDQHDQWAAAISHLPYLLSCALALGTPDDAGPIVGPGFRSTSRLAASSPRMMLDILKTNRQNVLSALERFREQLDLLEDRLAREDWDRLEELLARSATKQNELANQPRQRGSR